jgi:hypothetical protein
VNRVRVTVTLGHLINSALDAHQIVSLMEHWVRFDTICLRKRTGQVPRGEKLRRPNLEKEEMRVLNSVFHKLETETG